MTETHIMTAIEQVGIDVVLLEYDKHRFVFEQFLDRLDFRIIGIVVESQHGDFLHLIAPWFFCVRENVPDQVQFQVLIGQESYNHVDLVRPVLFLTFHTVLKN